MKERRALLVVVDLVLVNVAVLLALATWAVRGEKGFGAEFLLSQSYWFILLSFLWLFFANLSGMYELYALGNLSSTFAALVRTVALVVLAYLALYFVALPNSLPRLVVFYHGAATLLLIVAWRAAFTGLATRQSFRRRLLIVGAGWAGRTIVRAVQENYSAHYDIIGYVDDDPKKAGECYEGVTVLGAHERLAALVRERAVAELVLAITQDIQGGMFRAVLDAQEQGIPITPMAALYEQITARVPIEHVGDGWYVALPLGHAGTSGVYAIVKRIFDLSLALAGTIIFGLMLPFIALGIKLDSRGPIFYMQERVGKGGRIFCVRKLRTMVANAEPDGKAVWAATGDPRITRFGRFLRKARIDEFPQFLNVLRGEMSAVGPRPERPEFVERLEAQVPFYRLRHAVKPGMAGWAVVNYDYVDSIESARVRVEYDLYYIKHQSIWLDIQILFRMVGQVFALRGR